MAKNYIDMFPPFIPDKNAPANIHEQEQFYDLMRNLYQLAYDEPLLFVATLNEDDAYPNRFNNSSYDKLKLKINMKKFSKAVDDLVKKMFLLGQGSDVSLNKRQQIILSRLNIDNFTNLPAAWVWMSKRKDANLQAFSHCLFYKEYHYLSDIYAQLFDETAYRKLENWMLANGYKRFDIYDVTASDCNLSLTIANPKWSTNPPSGGFEYKIKHTGISARFNPYVTEPPVLGLCIPGGMKPYLLSFDDMDSELQGFVVRRTKKCNMCNYCVQTDKTGTRPMAYIPVMFQETEYKLCTYFPGYNYCWTQIDDDLVEKLIKMLSFMDRFAPIEAVLT